MFEFTCNICSSRNQVESEESLGREFPSCESCKSTVRTRWVIHALSLELFGQSLQLGDFPCVKEVRGIGLSDEPIYSEVLSERLGYSNTFYHREPRLDIRDLAQGEPGSQNFIIATDVFEHILYPIQPGFDNLARLLAPGGFILFTTPWRPIGFTVEHFPRLHRWELAKFGDREVLLNETKEGKLEIHGNLVFHGGAGHTLEMRRFARPDLVRNFHRAGLSPVFSSAGTPEYGILFPKPWSLPCVVRKAPHLDETDTLETAPRPGETGSSEIDTVREQNAVLYREIDGLVNWVRVLESKAAELERRTSNLEEERDSLLKDKLNLELHVDRLKQESAALQRTWSSAQQRVRNLEEQRTLIKRSKWLKLGNFLGFGPQTG